MSRKRPTQIELEHQNAELRKQNQQLQKRLKQALRQLRNDEDIQLDMAVIADLEAEEAYRDMLAGRKEEAQTEEFIIFRLADGSQKRIKKRVASE